MYVNNLSIQMGGKFSQRGEGHPFKHVLSGCRRPQQSVLPREHRAFTCGPSLSPLHPCCKNYGKTPCVKAAFWNTLVSTTFPSSIHSTPDGWSSRW